MRASLRAPLAAALVAAAVCVAPPSSARSAGSPGATFDSGPAMHADRIQAGVAHLPGGRVAVFGGHGGGSFTAWNTAEVWTESGGWTQLTMNSPHDVYALARLADGRFLLAGGSYDSGVPAYSTAEVFDPATDTFTAVAPMNFGRSFCAAATLASGKVLVAGGWDDETVASQCEVWDPAADTWTLTGAMTTARALPFVLPCPDGDAIVFGGFPPHGGSPFASAEVYDAATGTFTAVDSGVLVDQGFLPESSDFATPIEDRRMADGRFLFLGYRIETDGHRFILFTVDPATKAFEEFPLTPSLPRGIAYYGPVVDRTGLMAYVIVVDYWGTGMHALDAVDLVTGELHAADAWVTLPNLQHPASASRTVLPDGRLFMAGGLRTDRLDNNEGSNALLLATPDVRPVLPAPAAPADVGAAPAGGTVAVVSWSHDPPFEQGFRVERRQLPDGAWAQVGTPGPEARAFEDSGLVSGVGYEYRVCAFNASGVSAWASGAALTMPGGRWSASPPSSFGTVRVGAERTRTIRVRNRSRTQSLAFHVGELTGPFESGGTSWTVVPPRGRAKASVTFLPTNTGAARGSLTFETSDAKRPLVTMKLRGRGAPPRD